MHAQLYAKTFWTVYDLNFHWDWLLSFGVYHQKNSQKKFGAFVCFIPKSLKFWTTITVATSLYYGSCTATHYGSHSMDNCVITVKPQQSIVNHNKSKFLYDFTMEFLSLKTSKLALHTNLNAITKDARIDIKSATDLGFE